MNVRVSRSPFGLEDDEMEAEISSQVRDEFDANKQKV